MTPTASDHNQTDRAAGERRRLNAADLVAEAAAEGWQRVEEELEPLDRGDVDVTKE